MMSEERCNQCENACPVDALKCGRGRRYFGMEDAGHDHEHSHEHGHGKPDLSGPLGMLRQCGHMLHHGGAGGEDPLSALSEEEQKELERLLGLLLADWQSKTPPDEGGHRHGHHRG